MTDSENDIYFTTQNPVRIMFPNLRKPRSQRNGNPKFGILVLVHKDSDELQQVKDSIKAVMIDKWGSVEKISGRYNPLKSCQVEDAKREAEGKAKMFEKLEDADDYFYFNAQSHDKPGMVDMKLITLVDLSCFKSGCNVNIAANAYAWKEERGISIGLNHVQFHSEGESLISGNGGGGAGSPQAAFGGVGGKVADVDAVDDIFG